MRIQENFRARVLRSTASERGLYRSRSPIHSPTNMTGRARTIYTSHARQDEGCQGHSGMSKSTAAKATMSR